MDPSILALITAHPELAKELYSDLAKPGAQQLGKAIGHILRLPNIILGLSELGEHRMNTWAKRNLELYREKVNKIPEEDVCEVPPEIGVPILEKLSYTTNEDIANLFAELLAKASSSKTVQNAHPTFVQLIGMLSADEAKLIAFLGSNYPYKDFIPYINYRINSTDGHSFFDLQGYFTSLELQCDFMFKDNVSFYLENLISLGIISDEKPTFKTIFEFYKTLFSLYRNKSIEILNKINKSDYKDVLQIKRSYFQITERGKTFIDICTASDNENQTVVFSNYEDKNGKLFQFSDEVSSKEFYKGEIVMINGDEEVYVESSGHIFLYHQNAHSYLSHEKVSPLQHLKK